MSNFYTESVKAERDRLREEIKVERALNAELVEAGKAVLALPIAKGELETLDLGIGTATRNKAWLELRAALAKIEGQL
jgi:hypothetical protein